MSGASQPHDQLDDDERDVDVATGERGSVLSMVVVVVTVVFL